MGKNGLVVRLFEDDSFEVFVDGRGEDVVESRPNLTSALRTWLFPFLSVSHGFPPVVIKVNCTLVSFVGATRNHGCEPASKPKARNTPSNI